ncbi:hypothetical protein K523DRAFT_343778 [Schizophyllum commune Tattone D]|nr:hypothetical protein K523DRAFT_343778 [Schizophyllum commune Tattone D]
MNWTLRHGTRAAAHIPDNAGELCECTVFRAVHLINFYDICADLVINMDQTGVLTLLSGGGRTFDEKGKRQIDVVGKDEKRAYTLCVGSVCGGRPLPFQSVWPGTSTRSLPHLDAPGMTEALANGFDFAYANSPKKTSHFSTLSTMHRYLEYVVQPYIKSVIEEKNLDPDQKALLLLDCYPVHISEPFRVLVHKQYPNIFVIFIPANCT